MEYLIVKSDMTYKALIPTFSKIAEYDLDKYALPEVGDLYYLKEDFGLYSDDEERALAHALKMLRVLAKGGWEFEQQRDFYVDKLFADLRRYLDWCIGEYKQSEEIFRMVVEVSVELGYSERIPEFVKEYYEKHYLSSVEDEELHFAMGYNDLYIKLGDYELFGNGNVQKALQFYNLTDIDWCLLRDETTRVEFEISEQEREYLLGWHDTVRFMNESYLGNIGEDDLYVASAVEKDFWRYFLQFQRAKVDGDDLQVADAAESCMRTIVSCRENELPDRDSHRELLVAMHGVRRDSIFQTICVLSADTPKERTAYARMVVDAMATFQDGKQGIIGEYVRAHRKEKNLEKTIFMLCKTVQLVESIKNQLLVREINQDMAYYTSVRTLMYMFPNNPQDMDTCGKLSVMHIAYMNDPNEGKILEKYFLEDNTSIVSTDDRRSVEFPFVFMKCFTSLVDDLPMWEMYGDHAEGCCIVLDWENTINKLSNIVDVPLYRICYMKKNKSKYSVLKGDNPKIADINKFQRELSGLVKIARKVITLPDVYQVFMNFVEEITYLFKNSDYGHEQEMRILYHKNPKEHDFCHTAGEFPKLYVLTEFNVCIKEIIFGPKCSNMTDRVPYIQELLSTMCQKTGMSMPRLTVSAIEYM